MINSSAAMNNSVTAIVPAAGIGKRMQSQCPKQYLTLAGKTVIEHTLAKLLACAYIKQVVVAISKEDEQFKQLAIANHPKVITVIGGKERVDSVFAGLAKCQLDEWVMVHDAARPCVTVTEINQLVESCIKHQTGGLLAAKVKDTMKRAAANGEVVATVDRESLWHALTPQMYIAGELQQAIETGIEQGVVITDESSAIEAAGLPSRLVAASPLNLKITQPEDLALAEFILSTQLAKPAQAKQETV